MIVFHGSELIYIYQFTAMEMPVAVGNKCFPLSSLWPYNRSSITCCIHNYLRIILSYILSHIASVICKQVCALVQIGTGTNCSTWRHCTSYKMKEMADKCHWERTNKICFIKGHRDERGKNFPYGNRHSLAVGKCECEEIVNVWCE